jgi:hypothetical protein
MYDMLGNRFGRDEMELLGDVGHVAPRFSSFGDSVSVGAT